MSYVNPNIEARDTGDPRRGIGLFARAKISQGELVGDTEGETQILTKGQVSRLTLRQQGWCYEVDDQHEMCPADLENPSPIWFMNHSCDPNVGSHSDFHRTVAMRDIEPGEELTYDYAMTDAGRYDLQCFCGKPNCRKIIRGTDWMLAELQERYQGYFQKNVQEKIDAMKPGG